MASVVALHLGRWWCPLSADGAGCRGFRTCHRWLWPRLYAAGIFYCCPYFVALWLCLLSYFAIYTLISRFKGVLKGFYILDEYLYCLDALLALLAYLTCERLCGFEACCDFVLYFIPFVPYFISLPSILSLLSSNISIYLFDFLLCSFYSLFYAYFFSLFCCFFFPYGCISKKRGRKVFLRPLLSCCGLLFPLLFFGFNSQPFLYLVKIESEYIIQLCFAYSLRI